MKTKSVIPNILTFLPNEIDYAFATQISDMPDMPGIARIVVLRDYNISHSQKRIILDAEILHINVSTEEDVSSKFNSKIKDWIVTNQFYVMLRDNYGNMIPNPNYINEEDRVEGQFYTQEQTQKYQLARAFDFFALGFKNHTGSNQEFFSSIILVGDEINGLFDVYDSLSSLLMQMPPEINLTPELIEASRMSIQEQAKIQESISIKKK